MAAPAFRSTGADFAADGRAVLAMLADPRRPLLPAGEVAVVVAHPDDETIGCGALLARLPGVVIVHVTDGSPRDGVDADRAGFASAEAYAATRKVELAAALRHGDVRPDELVQLGLPDKEAMHHLEAIVDELAGLFVRRRIRLVLTHAYEGGHPDHDACAFAVAGAASRAGQIAVLEMPFYRAGPRGMLTQSFPPTPDCPGVAVRLTATERARKRAMLDAFATQSDVLSWFSLAAERFRIAPAGTDFTQPPNRGRVLYEGFGWGLTGAAWCAHARSALARLSRNQGARGRAAAHEPRPWP